ncbi:hypothetical protein AX768_26000 [Burkholderia sp. PAMC 28687]|uniref:FUSC family protein n=1 Tax=Burkholderia sp. PAMC 28687 TaxID=1795874 RepID=UPI00078226BF|nr:FUSC family protein [Burkholderia sp. PAMC 28687]AMM17635.1 hypothetical protein AX768_26000 [Burkholderia sp. PAMC 28687]
MPHLGRLQPANLIKRAADGWHARRADSLRIALQSLVASLLSYAVLAAIDPSNATWAIFSSLFTLQKNFDRSMRYGLGQMAGAVFGTAVGLAAIHVFPGSEQSMLRLGLTTLVTCSVTAVWPATSYGVVAAAVIALAPSAGISDAISRAGAIILGSGIGIAVSMSVWPQLARQRVFNFIAAALDDCSELLNHISIFDQPHDRAALDALHERFLGHLELARSVSIDTRIRAHFQSGLTLSSALSATERLWHGLVLLDRIGSAHGSHFTMGDREVMMDIGNNVKTCGALYLSRLAAYVRGGHAAPDPDACSRALNEAHETLREELDCSAARESYDRYRYLHSVIFGFEQVGENLIDLHQLLLRNTSANCTGNGS